MLVSTNIISICNKAKNWSVIIRNVSKTKLLLPILFLSLYSTILQAQYKTTIPLNKSVRHGILSNGMNYYIMHNEIPNNKVNYYLVQNIGSVMEDSTQAGFTQIIEQLAFKGTQHFPGQSLLNYLKRNHLYYGNDLQVNTAPDETIYQLSNLTADNENLLDTALLMVYDWANRLELEDSTINLVKDSLYKVQTLSNNAQLRLLEKTRPNDYNHSKYANPSKIVYTKDGNKLTNNKLRTFYNTWYRPDLQSIIIVGDIDALKMEKKIKDLFSQIIQAKNKPDRPYYPIADTESLSYVTAKDKEAEQLTLSWIFREDPVTLKDETYLRKQLTTAMLMTIVNNRLEEVIRKQTCNAQVMGMGLFELGRTKNATYLTAIPKDNDIAGTFETIATELTRLKRYGVTDTELADAKLSYINRYEDYLNQKNNISNNTYATQITNFYLKAEPFPDIEWEVNYAHKTISQISIKEINQAFDSFDNVNNSSLTISGPEDSSINYPSKNEILNIINNTNNATITTWETVLNNEFVIKDKLYTNNIIQVSPITGTQAKTYKLENGAKIVILPTTFNQNEILFSAFSYGGVSVVDKNDLASANLAVTLANLSGAGDYDAMQIRQMLTDKDVNVVPYLSSCTEGFTGSSSPREFENMLKLLYLKFQHPRFDENIYNTIFSTLNKKLEAIEHDKDKIFEDLVSTITANQNPRKLIFDENFLQKLSLESTKKVYLDRFNDASDFTFIFVGNINLDKDLLLIQKYIGSLPSVHRSEKWINHDLRPARGQTEKAFRQKMDIAETSAFYAFNNNIEYNIYSRTMVRIITDILNQEYTQNITIKEHDSIEITVTPDIEKIPYEHASVSIKFNCKPQEKDKLTEQIKSTIQRLYNEGPDSASLSQIKVNYINKRKTADTQNSYWIQAINNALINNDAITDEKSYDLMMHNISGKDVRNFARKLFKNGDSVSITMLPE